MLAILCIDGFDNDLVDFFKLNMTYEERLTIPRELFRRDQPFTPNIWGSMFTGDIFVHSDSKYIGETGLGKLRLIIRHFLHDNSIRWFRSGLNFWKDKDSLVQYGSFEPNYFIWRKEVEKSVFDDYHSFIYAIPSVSDNYMFTSETGDLERYEVFKLLCETIWRYNYELVGLYTHYIDYKAHWTLERTKKNLFQHYVQVHSLAKGLESKGHDVIVVSDHATLFNHKNYAYIGATFPFEAESVLDVYQVIKEYLKNQ